MSELERLDYYTLLGIEPSVDVHEVKRAFRRFARRYHPDRFAGGDPIKRKRATDIYRRGSEAYQVLIDPVAREAYHRVLRRGQLRLRTEDRERAWAAAAEAERKENAAPIRLPRAVEMYNRSMSYARAKDFRMAWKVMKKAYEFEPSSELIRKRLAQLEARVRKAR
ncbi:MAG: DnaJ domain-containing protein [Sandaracinaceae bacterium]